MAQSPTTTFYVSKKIQRAKHKRATVENPFVYNPTVNGSNDGQRSVEEEEPFIVVAAAVENDGSSDPNEAFIPTKDDTNGPTFNLLSQADLARELLDAEVIEASDDSSQESSSFKFPTNDNGADKAGFKLLTQEDLDDVVILEAG